MTRLTASLAAALLFGTACSSTRGYRSRVVPEVTVIPEEALRPTDGQSTSITVVRPHHESLQNAVNVLLDRVWERRGRQVSHLEAAWMEVQGGGAFRCEARIRPVVLVRPDGEKTLESGEIEGGDPADLGPQFLARSSWYGPNRLPSTDTLSRARWLTYSPQTRLRVPGFRQWGLMLFDPACVASRSPAHGSVTVHARYY